MDPGYCLEDLLKLMDNRDEWRERESWESVLAAQHDDVDDDDGIYYMSVTYE